MQLLRLDGPYQEAVTEDEAKLYLRIEHHLDDNILRTMIAAARTMVEQYTGQTLIEQKWRMTIGANDRSFNKGGTLQVGIPMSPFQKLDGRPKVIKPNKILEIANYKLSRDAGFGTVEVITCLGSKDELQLEFTVGYGPTAESVPASFKQAILMLLAEMYENRSGGSNSKAVPVIINGSVKNLLDAHRVRRLL